jgi:soluble lytic murein transglycosylase
MVQHHESMADPYLMISLIRQESAFNERARSRVGARGLMQLMPQTARRMERVSLRALFDPKTNIRLGVRFFSHLTERYEGEVELALAAYNAGPHKVDAWRQRYPIDNRLLFVDLIPYRETREYVASIARNYYFYKKLYASDGPAGDEGAAGRAPASDSGKSAVFKLFSS